MMTQTSGEMALYNFDQIREIAAGSQDFLKSLAGIFIKTTPADSAEMMKALKASDWQKVSKYAHKMKSTVDSMNILSIKTDIRTLEIDAKNKTNLAALAPIASHVDNTVNEVARQLKKEFSL